MTPTELRASLFADEQEERKVHNLWLMQYCYQNVFQKASYPKNYCEELSPYWIDKVEMDLGFLQLRTTSQLTDDEKVKCYHLHSACIAYDYTMDFAPFLDMANHWLESDGFETLFEYTQVSQYLLRIGILLPFTYITSTGEVKTLSVEQILALGWAVIKQD